MAKKSSNLLLFGLIAVVLAFVFFSRNTTNVIVRDSPVKFSSVRKHPFDVYADPYHPPERENPYLFGRDYSYQQVGVLSDYAGSMLPLFGRPSPNSSSRWEYYTMNGNLKLPVSIGGKTCNSDTGCPELLSGPNERVDVVGKGDMRSFIYDTKQLRR